MSARRARRGALWSLARRHSGLEPDPPHGHFGWTAPRSLSELNYRRCARSSASHAARCVACHGVRSHAVPVALVGECSMPLGVERRAPAALVVLGQLQVEALAVHPNGYVADAGPGVEPGAQRVQGKIVREHRAPGEADGSTEQPVALVEHALLDDLVRLEQKRLAAARS